MPLRLIKAKPTGDFKLNALAESSQTKSANI
jgi:hypothetical protein